MIRADMIPDEVYEAASRIEDKNDIGAVILAAINAWPGVTTTSWFENSVRKAVLNIPLPQEVSDE